jgi:hypothetical protein
MKFAVFAEDGGDTILRPAPSLVGSLCAVESEQAVAGGSWAFFSQLSTSLTFFLLLDVKRPCCYIGFLPYWVIWRSLDAW